MKARVTALLAAIAAALMLAFGPTETTLAQTEDRFVGSIAGTRWTGQATWDDGQSHNDMTAYFRSDGVLIYGYSGATYDNGRWRQRDMLVNFDTNNYFALYVGHVRGDRMEGVMYNKNGLQGVWSFERR